MFAMATIPYLPFINWRSILKSLEQWLNFFPNFDKYFHPFEGSTPVGAPGKISDRIISSFLKEDWKWERIAPLERSILIYGTFELAVSDKALVINELVDITKGFIPGDSYKFINAILNNVGKYYEKVKKN